MTDFLLHSFFFWCRSVPSTAWSSSPSASMDTHSPTNGVSTSWKRHPCSWPSPCWAGIIRFDGCRAARRKAGLEEARSSYPMCRSRRQQAPVTGPERSGRVLPCRSEGKQKLAGGFDLDASGIWMKRELELELGLEMEIGALKLKNANGRGQTPDQDWTGQGRVQERDVVVERLISERNGQVTRPLTD